MVDGKNIWATWKRDWLFHFQDRDLSQKDGKVEYWWES